MPPAHAGPGGAGVVEALFTAVSAVTVTGLVVVDTPTCWSPLGHVVVLALIQVGGLGIMTSASLLGLLTSRRSGMAAGIGAVEQTRSISPGAVRRVLANVVRVSLGIEAAVALALALRLLVAHGARARRCGRVSPTRSRRSAAPGSPSPATRWCAPAGTPSCWSR